MKKDSKECWVKCKGRALRGNKKKEKDEMDCCFDWNGRAGGKLEGKRRLKEA